MLPNGSTKAFHIMPLFKHPASAEDGCGFVVPYWFVTDAADKAEPTLAYVNKTIEIRVGKWTHKVTVKCLKNAAAIAPFEGPLGHALTKPKAAA